MSDRVQIAAVPMTLTWDPAPRAWELTVPNTLTVQAGPGTDLFSDPAGNPPVATAPKALGIPPSGDFILSARLSVEFTSTFDAGVLLVYAAADSWAKLCFEYSPAGEPTVVTVVTRGVSDDCNSFTVAGNHVWLRIARIGRTFAFHAALPRDTEPLRWNLVRYFTLDTPSTRLEAREEVHVGFLAQSPTGDGCRVTFSDITFHQRTVTDIRDGS